MSSSIATSRVATRTVRGGSVFGIWPLNRYRRVELVGGVLQYQRGVQRSHACRTTPRASRSNSSAASCSGPGLYVPLGINFVQETTVFREFGPLAGNTMRLSYEVSPAIGDTLGRQTADVDARYYLRLGGSGLLALRARGFKSWGDAPDFMYFGGNSEMRGYEYLEFIGSESAFLNAELRFPFIEAMLTPLGVLGGIRGVLFANMGGGHFDGQPFKWLSNKAEVYTPIVGFIPGVQRTDADLRPADAHRRASAGGRARVVRHRPRNVRARVPGPLRLGVAHAAQQGLGGSSLRGQRRQRGVPQAAVRDVDWIRLLDW